MSLRRRGKQNPENGPPRDRAPWHGGRNLSRDGRRLLHRGCAGAGGRCVAQRKDAGRRVRDARLQQHPLHVRDGAESARPRRASPAEFRRASRSRHGEYGNQLADLLLPGLRTGRCGIDAGDRVGPHAGEERGRCRQPPPIWNRADPLARRLGRRVDLERRHALRGFLRGLRRERRLPCNGADGLLHERLPVRQRLVRPSLLPDDVQDVEQQIRQPL